MRRLIFATNNKHKVTEVRAALSSIDDIEIVTLAEAGLEGEIPETADTLQGNALQKALWVWERTHTDCFADDTGLEVDILGGRPGVHTARYGGPQKDFDANMDRLLADMGIAEKEASIARAYGLDTTHANRRARFHTVVTLILGGEMKLFDGVLEGTIARTKKGNGGFGYDPVFIPDEIPAADGTLVPNTERRTLAELSEEDKNAISHRGKAMRAMAAALHEQ